MDVASPEQTDTLGSRSVQGAAWTFAFSAIGKVLTFGGQAVIAWILLPDDVGLFGMALSVIGILATFSSSDHLRNILIQQQDRFEENATDVFWMGLLINVVLAAIVLVAAPAIGVMYDEPRVVPLVRLATLNLIIIALGTVHSAALSRDLRFREIATINLVQIVIVNVGSIGLALLGFGAYALLIPHLVSLAYAVVSYRLKVGAIAIGRPNFKIWMILLAPAVWLMLNGFFASLQQYGTNVVIGIVHDAEVTGQYFWGFMIAIQAVFLVATKLWDILFASLTRLNDDPERQYRAFHTASRTLFAFVVPVVVLQIILARPGVELIFDERWYPAIPVIQWLSVGIVMQPFITMATSILLARNENRRLALYTATIGLGATVAALIGSHLGAEAAIAQAVGISLVGTGLFGGWIAYRQFGHGWHKMFEVMRVPLFLGSLCAAAAYGALLYLPASNRIVVILVITALVGILYVGGIRILMPDLITGLLDRLRRRSTPVRATQT